MRRWERGSHELDQTLAELRQLAEYSGKWIWKKPAFSREKADPLLTEIATFKSPSAVPFLLPWVL